MYDDERAAYEQEIRQLKDENERLRRENLGWQTKFAQAKDQINGLLRENEGLKELVQAIGGNI